MSAAPERIGRYRLVEKLGQGGMATVYRAEDTTLGRDVAVKLMHPFLADNREAAGRFQREARAVAALRHPNVLAVHDYAPEEGDRPAYLVTELIQGPTLKRFLDEHGAPLPEVAAMIGWKLGQALAAAHAQGIVHRDVKPENVMIDGGGRVVLCDFGIARIASAEATMTATGALIGSPAYMSPEQAAGDELDARSDLFSLGTVMYLAATGAMPFVAKEPLALLAKIHRGEHAPPSAKNPRVPPYLERVIEKCLKVSLEERWQDAGAIAEALEKGLRADGFVEVEKEIAAYFADPPGYNAGVEQRIVAASIAEARAAAARGEAARAIAYANRVLAWRPGDPAAHQVVEGIGRSGRRWWRVGVGVAVVAVAAGVVGVVRPWRAKEVATTRAGTDTAAATATATATVTATVAGTATRTATGTATGTSAPPPILAPAKRRHPATVEKAAVAPVVVAPPTVEKPAVVEEKAKADGFLSLAGVQPYCAKPAVDGKTVDAAKAVAVAPGSHRVHCDGPRGRALDREVTVGAGETVKIEHRFLGEATVTVKLARGDAVEIDGGPRGRDGETVRVPAGNRDVRLLRGGQAIGHGFVDFGEGACTLRDDPLDCVKP